jgi:hypothetical protein
MGESSLGNGKARIAREEYTKSSPAPLNLDRIHGMALFRRKFRLTACATTGG